MNKANFSYEQFCKYVKNKMSIIYKDNQSEYQIMVDTQPLQKITPSELGMLTEDETLRYIYDNNLFHQMEEIIKENPVYIYSAFKDSKEELEDKLEDEDDWELEQ